MTNIANNVKWLLVGLLLGLAIVNSKAADPWDKTDKALATALVLVTVVDYAQTRTIAKNPHLWFERNPLLGEHPTLGEVNRHFIGGLILGGVIAHYLPASARKTFLGTITFIELGVVIHNHGIGIKTSF